MHLFKSAGVGRTGTFITCDMLLRQVHDRTKLNVFKTALKLREQRSNMVQTQVSNVLNFNLYNNIII